MNLETAITYDCEIYPNLFTFAMQQLYGDLSATWEISPWRDDRRDLIAFFNHLSRTQTFMIGFNNVHFDYPLIDLFFNDPLCSVDRIYDKAQAIIEGNDRFAHTVWADRRFAPQIDLFKIHHFDNKAKSTSLKALEINMRSPYVVDMPIAPGTVLTKEQIDKQIIPYNNHDVAETKKFAHYSMDAIKFRLSLVDQFGIDVMNWSDTKIGSKMIENKIGHEICYEMRDGRRHMRQTPRGRIALNDIIFSYIQFQQPEFNRVLNYLRAQVLQSDEIQQFTDDRPPSIKTKGVFTDLKATIGGFDFDFGTGGIHGSVENKKIQATDEWSIVDVDVAALYPSIAIVNNLAPAHLGERFTQVYRSLPDERKKWQKEKGKKCVEANTLKLASNGVYGNSNNTYSPFYDPQFTLTITINGQLLLCMLAERLLTVPTLHLIQINTDGITFYIHRSQRDRAAAICAEWEKLTALTLESVDYKRMFIRDVNNYVAESGDGSLKLKGAYWTPDALDYTGSIGNAQPAAWHKDLGNLVSIRAAVAAMIHGVDPETFIRLTTNPFDFMCRVKAKRSDALVWGGRQIQRNSRYYVSTAGAPLVKLSPPAGPVGACKRANGVSEYEYNRVMAATGGAWDASVCTKNKSRYENRETAIQAGHLITVCNDAAEFDWSTVNYDWYVNEARKLIIT